MATSKTLADSKAARSASNEAGEQVTTEQKLAFGRPMPKYLPCKGSADGKHKFERITHDHFEKCTLCGQPRFALKVS